MGLEVLEDMERCMAGGWTDGLPVIPPYGSLVQPMVAAMGWEPTDVIGTIAEQSIEVLAEHAGAAAVMAGCLPEYGPVLRAVTDALLDPAFNLSGVEVTTGGPAALVIVGGPAVAAYGFAHGANALGANVRANATVGRFAQMLRRFCGQGGGTLQSHGTMGHPGRLSFCIAEHPSTRWPPFHTQLGIDPEASAITVLATEGPNSVNNHYVTNGEAVLETIADTLAHFGTTNFYYRTGGYLVALGPEHAELVAADFTREEAHRYLLEHARRSTDELTRLGRIPRHPRDSADVQPGRARSPISRDDQLLFIEIGADGGKFSAVLPRWVGNRTVISRRITHDTLEVPA